MRTSHRAVRRSVGICSAARAAAARSASRGLGAGDELVTTGLPAPWSPAFFPDLRRFTPAL